MNDESVFIKVRLYKVPPCISLYDRVDKIDEHIILDTNAAPSTAVDLLRDIDCTVGRLLQCTDAKAAVVLVIHKMNLIRVIDDTEQLQRNDK